MDIKHDFTSPLLTDRYLLTMCLSFFNSGKHEQPAVYEFFVRKAPFDSKFFVVCGINEAIQWLSNAKYSQAEIDFVRTDLGLAADHPFIHWLANADFSRIRARAIEEGTVVYPYIPLLILQGPLALVQLTETLILNKLNYSSLIATNARLLRETIGNDAGLLEFGLRRAQGPDGGTIGAVYAYIGGALGTSNVLAGYKYGVPIVGTMAHSYVTSFLGLEDLNLRKLSEEQKQFIKECKELKQQLGFHDSNEGELASFIAFSFDMPNNFVCLVDTYDTLKSGVPNYAIVATTLAKHGGTPKGLRLDSGDLAKLSLQAREVLKSIEVNTGQNITSTSKIIASDDLSIKKISEMKGKHSIDVFAVGTKLITCYEQAALGMVCKLASLNGQPRLKFSETVEKSTLPGLKQVLRFTGRLDGKDVQGDIIICDGESLSGSTEVYKLLNYDNLLTISIDSCSPIMLDVPNNTSKFTFDVKQMRQLADALWKASSSLRTADSANPHDVYISKKLRELLFTLRASLTSHN